MNNIVVRLLVMVSMIGMACTPAPTPKDLSQEALIPQPVSLTATGSSFALNAETGISYSEAGLQGVADLFAAKLRPATGFSFAVTEGKKMDNAIHLSLGATEASLGTEGYVLEITEKGVHLSAMTPAGVFNGLQTLRQLLPAQIEAKSTQAGPWEIATGKIMDYPDYAYRGSMLDVARHFFDMETVKTYIDYLAAYKMNYLHLHLSDDQGWRIEIKSWPKLTEVGGSTQVGGGKGGFYTQAQYQELVQYAADRFITIVPEIDMPGHTNAALASYPELYCTGKKPALYTGIEVGFSTLCTSNEKTYEFVDDVVRELAAITPGPYIHIGGDESHVTPMKDYIPFINRAQAIVLKHGKQVMGWDEITHATLVPNAVAQFWDNAENAKAGVAQNAKILMSPAKRAYMDMQYDSTSHLGLHWAAYIEVDDAYQWDPATYADGISRENILGVEAALWSETITNLEDIEYMVFPRLLGYAEIAWSPAEGRSWDEYKIRLGRQKARFETMGLNYYPSARVPWQ